jgi:hypothetical protein
MDLTHLIEWTRHSVVGWRSTMLVPPPSINVSPMLNAPSWASTPNRSPTCPMQAPPLSATGFPLPRKLLGASPRTHVRVEFMSCQSAETTSTPASPAAFSTKGDGRCRCPSALCCHTICCAAAESICAMPPASAPRSSPSLSSRTDGHGQEDERGPSVLAPTKPCPTALSSGGEVGGGRGWLVTDVDFPPRLLDEGNASERDCGSASGVRKLTKICIKIGR